MRYLHSTIKFVIRDSHFDLYYLYSSTIMTIQKVLKRSDIAEDTRIVEGNFADIRKKKMETEEKEC